MPVRSPRPFSSSRNTSGLALTLTLISMSLPLACQKASAPAPTPPGEETVAAADAETNATDSDDACRSWSDLDLDTLETLPETPYNAAFETVWRTVLEKHYDPTLNCLDWPAIRVEYGAQLADAKDDAAAFELMTKMLARLGQSHLAVVPPREQVAGEPRAAAKTGDAHVPIVVRVLDGEAIVVDAAAHGQKSGLPAGAAILSIDDNEVAPVIAAAAEDHPREVEATFAARRLIGGWLSCPAGASKKIQYQAYGAKKPKTKKVKCRPIEAERVSMGNLKNVPAVVEHRMIEGTELGYISFNIWMIPLVAKIEAAMTELRAKGMKALVLDLRGNPGGVGAMVMPLGRQLLSEDTDLGTMRMREGEQVFKINAGGDPFTGPIAVLVDEGTASTSEIFGQAMQDLGRVHVYGAVPSQGAALPSLIEQLPGGGLLQLVVADYQSPKGVAVEGRGVQPDTVVPETREDFANGRDPVLDAAVADLKNK